MILRRRRLITAAAFVSLLCFTVLTGSACRQDRTDSVGVSPVTGVNTNFFNAPEKLGDDAVWKAVERAKIPVMRFPGGTRGNSYDWRTGKIRADRGGDLQAAKRYAGDTVSMDDFMSRAKKAGVSVSYVLNITDSPESIRELARHWKSTDAPVRWVELGNEYYLQDLVEGIGGPAGYLDRARRALTALRAGGYQGAVGLVAAPEGMPGRADSDASFRTWNEKIAEADIRGIDAIILHYYPSLEHVGFDEVYRESPLELASTITTLKKRFPHKRVWITEWNLGKPADAPQFNTLWHALFNLEMLKVMLDSDVDLASYHVLTGNGWELLGPDRYTLNDDTGGPSDLIRRVPYFAFQMVNEAQSDGATYVPAREKILASKGISYMAFRTRDELRIVAWTPTEATSDIRVRTNELAPKFVGGKVLRGKLGGTNGSLLTMKGSKARWTEKIKPAPISSPRLEGPGAVLLDYSLETRPGNAS